MEQLTLSDIKTVGIPLSDNTLMTSNGFNNKLRSYQVKNGDLIDITGNLSKDMYGIEDLNKAFGNQARSLVAQSVQADVIATGGSLNSDFWRTHQRLLSTLYHLTGLAYVSVASKDNTSRTSYLATKNNFILSYMEPYTSNTRISDNRRNTIEGKRLITKQELDSESFEVIKFVPREKDDGKFYLTTGKLHPNSVKTLVLPYTLAIMRTESIVDRLKKSVCEIEYKVAGEKRLIRTTLKDRKDLEAAVKHYCKYDACVLPVRDFIKKEHILLNTLDITSIKECKGGK